MTLPGDAHQRNQGAELQHAVTIAAPPAVVWPWLLQLGQDRAGFYSYDWLERALGADIRNATQIKPEWQQRCSHITAVAMNRASVTLRPLGDPNGLRQLIAFQFAREHGAHGAPTGR